MELNEIQELIKLLDSTNISEFKLKTEGFSLLVRTRAYTEAMAASKTPAAVPMAYPQPSLPPLQHVVTATPAPAPVAIAAQTETATPSNDANFITIKSPMVGTFYRAQSSDKDPYVKIGDTITKGSVLCIIEAMKLFNEIESEYSGTIVKILVDNELPVAYDQPLFVIKPQ